MIDLFSLSIDSQIAVADAQMSAIRANIDAKVVANFGNANEWAQNRIKLFNDLAVIDDCMAAAEVIPAYAEARAKVTSPETMIEFVPSTMRVGVCPGKQGPKQNPIQPSIAAGEATINSKGIITPSKAFKDAYKEKYNEDWTPMINDLVEFKPRDTKSFVNYLKNIYVVRKKDLKKKSNEDIHALLEALNK